MGERRGAQHLLPQHRRGGALVGGTPESAAEVVRAVRPRVTRPLLREDGPGARAGDRAGPARPRAPTALSLINTINGMSIDVRTRRSRLSKPTGGVSGPAIHAIAVAMVWEARQAVKIPINGMGGIASWRDAAEMILAGATSVTVGTANFYDPRLRRRRRGRPRRLGRRAERHGHQRADWSL